MRLPKAEWVILKITEYDDGEFEIYEVLSDTEESYHSLSDALDAAELLLETLKQNQEEIQ